MNMKLLRALPAAGALALAGCGDDGADESAGRPAGNGVDRAFAAEMIPHHQSAVQMAEIARDRADSDFVRNLAGNIIRTQEAEISTLRGEDKILDAAGVKRGSLDVPDHMTGMDDDPEDLRSADRFDRAFIEMMIPHHQGAIEMAKAELAKGADVQLKALAQDIIDAQRREIDEMRKHLDDPNGDHGSGHSS